MSNNIYIVKICPKGGGKTPAANVFLRPLAELEREEKEDYDEEVNDRKERKSKKFKVANEKLDEEDCSKLPTASFDFNRKEGRMDEDEGDLELFAVPGPSKLPPDSFDFIKKNKEKKDRNSSKNDRKAKTEASHKIQDALDATNWDTFQETDQSGDSKKTSSPSEFMF